MEVKKEQVIYVIINKVNGKRYIGSAINFKTRKVRHLSDLKNRKHHSRYLQNSYNKHGEENFEFKILEHVEDVKLLIETEQKWLDSERPEFNVCKVAGLNSHLGLKRSEETKKKISEALTGIKRSEETKKKISKSKKGVPIDGGNMNKDKIGQPLSEEHKNKIALANSGRVLTDEHRNKISETLKKQNIQTPNSITIEQYSLSGELINKFPSITKAEKSNKIGRSVLNYNLIKRGKTEYGGYIWKVINN